MRVDQSRSWERNNLRFTDELQNLCRTAPNRIARLNDGINPMTRETIEYFVDIYHYRFQAPLTASYPSKIHPVAVRRQISWSIRVCHQNIKQNSFLGRIPEFPEPWGSYRPPAVLHPLLPLSLWSRDQSRTKNQQFLMDERTRDRDDDDDDDNNYDGR